jgi:hypothetical protein
MKNDVKLNGRLNEHEQRLWDETFLSSVRNNIRDSAYQTATMASSLADHAVLLRRGIVLRLRLENL